MSLEPDLTIDTKDQEILQRLAEQVAELAARPIEQEKRGLWYRHNALESTRPLIFCDPENGWNEIIPPDHIECAGDLARRWEMRLRKEIFWGAEMRDDRVIEPYFDVAHVHADSGWGLRETQIGGERGGAYAWDAPVKSYDDLYRLHFPQITIDDTVTAQLVELAAETLGHLLTVRLKTKWWWSLGMTWLLVNLRGLAQVMYDLLDHPDDLHRLMAFLRDGHLAQIDFLEQNGLLSPNNDGAYVGSGGFGWTRELPRPDVDGHTRARDMWGFAESQETISISPDMFAEFIFPYQLPLLEQFGLNCYGCCEPLDERWPVVQQIPNLRRISVSPWSDLAGMAERLGGRYIYSMKPSPTDLAMDAFDEQRIRSELREALRLTRDCRVEVIMKDNHTIGNDPRRVVRWVRIARQEAEAL